MTAKRLFGVVKGHREHIADHTGRLYSDSEVADLLNTVYEDCNMYRKDALKAEKDKEELLKENEQLKKENKELQDTIETICKDFEESHGMDIRNADWFTAW